MTTTFAAASRLSSLADGRFGAEIDASWGQGRALFGGIQAALMVRACEASTDLTGRSLKTLAVSFCKAAAPGKMEVAARLERGGRYVSHLTARLEQNGETVATALAVYARDRDDALVIGDDSLPDMPPPQELQRLPKHPFIPVFTRHLDMRFLPGTAPYSGSDDPVVAGWLRFAETEPLDNAGLVALLDGWPPSVLPTLAPPRASASVDLRYDIFEPVPIAGAKDDDYYAFHCVAKQWRAGHGVDEGRFWAPDGRLVARIRQLRVIF